MKNETTTGRAPGVRLPRWLAPAMGLVLVLSVTACDIDSILEVTDPDIVTPGSLTGPTGLATLRAGALGDFALAYAGDAGGEEGQILVSGMFTDEYFHSGTFTSRAAVDRRDVRSDNETMDDVFQNLQDARQAAESAARRLQDEVDDPAADPRIAEMLNLAGFTYNMFGENYCSGVPFSDLDETGDLVPGDPHTTEEIFERAVARFDEALGNPGGSDAMTNLARVGKARALLNLGRYEEAATTAAQVPDAFSFDIGYSTNSARQENGVYNFNVVFERWSLANREAGEGLPFREAMDPRVPWERTLGADGPDFGFDEETPQYDMLKYPGRAAPIPLATGDEARLIQAEAALQRGDFGGMLDLINQVRDRNGVDEIDDAPGSRAEAVDLLFRERAFTLFASSHRLGDLRRLVRQYGRSAGDIFPTGAYHKTGDYGSDVNLPVPQRELNNPNFTGCIDREA